MESIEKWRALKKGKCSWEKGNKRKVKKGGRRSHVAMVEIKVEMITDKRMCCARNIPAAGAWTAAADEWAADEWAADE